jgi:hypothetical protein
MADDAIRGDAPPREDIPAQRLHRLHLRFGERAVAPFVARIDDLDADRNGVERGLPHPVRHPGVPGAALFGHQPPNRAVLLDDDNAN